MKKKFLITLIVIVFGMLAFYAVSTSAASVDDLSYTISNGEVTITSCKRDASGELVIPETIEGCPVTTIGKSAFSACYSLTSIEIPVGVTTIGEKAFWNCIELDKTIIHDLKLWCNIYFEGESSNPVYYSNNLYLGSSLITELLIPKDVTNIGQYTFYNCDSLEKIIIPNGVINIDARAFAYCDNLESIVVSESLKNIGSDVFKECNYIRRVFYNGNKNAFNITVASGNLKFQYAIKIFFYYVDLVGQDGNVTTIKNTADSVIDTSEIEKDDYDIKLYTDEECTVEFNKDSVITQNTTLYYKYVTKQCTYKFVDEDGTLLKVITVDYGTEIVPPENPTKASTQQYTYTFAGWSGYTQGMSVKDNATFTATYTSIINQYTYKFLDEDGTLLKETTVDYGTKIVPPANPEDKDPYIFDYWEGFTKGMTLTDDITFTAVYKYKNYKITVDGITNYITVTYNNSFVISPQSKPLYLFKGYFTQKDGGGVQVTDESGKSLNVYDTVGNLYVYPYFESVYLNKFQLQGDESVQLGGTITQEAIFATDKDVRYLIATIKYPEYLTFKGIKGVDFIEADKDTETVVGEYKYLDVTCAFDYEGNFVQRNKNYIPFVIEFDISKDAPGGECEIYAENIMLIGDDTFDVTDITSHTFTILPKLAESIEIIGETEIDSVTKYSVVISPDYTSEKSVLWSVDDESVATIDRNGTLTPVKAGTVTVTATAKDGSGVFATKTVNVIVCAMIDSLDFGDGVVSTEFNPYVRKYTVYVKKDSTSISLTPTFSGGVLRPNGSGIWVSGRSKDFVLKDTGITTITLNRENVTDMTNSIYTIEVVKFEGTKTEVSDDNKSFVVTPINIKNGNTVILALFEGDKFIEMQAVVYEGEAVYFTTTEFYTNAKVMVWSSVGTCLPLCNAESVQ